MPQYNTQIDKNRDTYPDETVVEMEPEERAGEAGRGGDDLLHLLSDDGLHVGACLAVVADLQLRRRRRASCKQQEGHRKQQQHTKLDRHDQLIAQIVYGGSNKNALTCK